MVQDEGEEKETGKLLSVVVSVYNEEQALQDFYRETSQVLQALSWDYELIFVNDGSRDGSLSILQELSRQDSQVRVINFSRNFGHEAAMIAGLDYSRGDGIVCMDADLQHPPECLSRIVRCFEEGYQVISMVRTKNEDAGLIKNLTSSAFYWLINAISDVHFEPNASDFFAIDQAVAQVLRTSYREKVRFLRGYVQNVGFRKTTLSYEARPRVAGESKYSLKKLFAFSVNTILCFSNMPLKLGIYAGMFSAFLGIAVMVYTLFTRAGAPSGYATIVFLICFMFAMLFVVVGIIGEYIAILFTELKDRPVYIVADTCNIDHGKACSRIDSNASRPGNQM
ncbi:MAG: glycosyltransferase family 2 protein [Lachnospiraceae bacterium]|nr:glycosyltransferase family 2 protein [Lachnospiraceae bacterium]